MEDIKFVLKQMVEVKLEAHDLSYLERIRDKPEMVEVFYKNKMFELDKNLRVDALNHVLKNKYIQYYNQLIETETVEDLLPTLKKIKEQRDNQDVITNSDILFITISPAEGELKPLNFIKLLERFCSFKWIKQYVYVLEQRFNGTENEKYKKLGDGLHAHILLDRNKHKLSHVKRDFARVFGTYTINVDWSFRHVRDILKTQDYIIALKKDEDKQLKQLQDVKFREQEGVKKFYGNLWE